MQGESKGKAESGGSVGIQSPHRKHDVPGAPGDGELGGVVPHWIRPRIFTGSRGSPSVETRGLMEQKRLAGTSPVFGKKNINYGQIPG